MKDGLYNRRAYGLPAGAAEGLAGKVLLNYSAHAIQEAHADRYGVAELPGGIELEAHRAQRGSYDAPLAWRFEPGEFLTEIPNPCRTCDCGCGVSFATLEWVKNNHPGQPVWFCRIRFEDLADVVVPFRTDGKARCARLELLEKL